MMKHLSRRDFLKSLGALGGFLAAQAAGFVPELSSASSAVGSAPAPTVLPASTVSSLKTTANGYTPYKKLHQHLIGKGYSNLNTASGALRFRPTDMVADLLMTAYNDPGTGEGATMFYLKGTGGGQNFKSAMSWIVNGDASYYGNDMKITRSADASKRMKGAPRLPQPVHVPPPIDRELGAWFVETAEAQECCNLWSACYVWNALCASLAVGCVLNPAICPFAAGACVEAVANCNIAGLCGPAC